MSRQESRKIAEDCILKYVLLSGADFKHATSCAITEQKAILAELKTIGDMASKFQYANRPDEEAMRLIKIRYCKIEDVIIELQDML